MKLPAWLHPVKIEGSSQISEVGYDVEGSRLFVVFARGGSVYEYSPVGGELYEGLVSAESVGSYFNKRIRSDKSISYKEV